MHDRPNGDESIDQAVRHARPVPDPIPSDHRQREPNQPPAVADSRSIAASEPVELTDRPDAANAANAANAGER